MAKRKDMRRINKVWDFRNPMGQWFTFALIGSGRNSYVTTLHTGRKTRADSNLVGEVYRSR